jgi:hypothetical protein
MDGRRPEDSIVPSLAENNPYIGSNNVTALEAEVLGEYARMANNLERVSSSRAERVENAAS